MSASPLTRDRVWNTLVRVDHQLTTGHAWALRWLRESSPQLNQIIGAVTSGMETVDAIAGAADAENPSKPVPITTATVANP